MNIRIKQILKGRLETQIKALELESREHAAQAVAALTGNSAQELAREAIDLELSAGHLREILSRLEQS
ncbi:MAG: hypothetical protein WC130_04910 [Kiritimatiellia bacterium]